MKKLVVSLIILLFVIISCQKKAVPVITERKNELPGKIETVDPSPATSPDTAVGKTIFTNRCGRCHGLPKPAQYTAQLWEGILSYMIPRARLNDAQGVHVRAYLKVNAAK